MNEQYAERLDILMDDLGVPVSARLPTPRKIPKVRMFENATFAPGDRRWLDLHISSMWACASLRPERTPYAAVDDGVAFATEVLIIAVELRDANKGRPSMARLAKMIHVSMPYPIVLVVRFEQDYQVSFLPLRRDARRAERYVWDEEPVVLTSAADGPWMNETGRRRWAKAAEFSTDLQSLYIGWARAPLLDAMEIVLGEALPLSAEYWTLVETRERLNRLQVVEKKEASLIRSLRKEKQLNRRVELNLQLQKLRKERSDFKQLLMDNA